MLPTINNILRVMMHRKSTIKPILLSMTVSFTPTIRSNPLMLRLYGRFRISKALSLDFRIKMKFLKQIQITVWQSHQFLIHWRHVGLRRSVKPTIVILRIFLQVLNVAGVGLPQEDLRAVFRLNRADWGNIFRTVSMDWYNRFRLFTVILMTQLRWLQVVCLTLHDTCLLALGTSIRARSPRCLILFKLLGLIQQNWWHLQVTHLDTRLALLLESIRNRILFLMRRSISIWIIRSEVPPNIQVVWILLLQAA